jgi:hypothetical protein
LVRPDGFVAWRASGAQGASAQTFAAMLARLSFINPASVPA